MGFTKAVQKFVVIIIVACPLFATADWVEQRLTLEWRNWLTSYLLKAYFADRSFFKLKQQAGSLDNPDQVLNTCYIGVAAVLAPATTSVETCPAPSLCLYRVLDVCSVQHGHLQGYKGQGDATERVPSCSAAYL